MVGVFVKTKSDTDSPFVDKGSYRPSLIIVGSVLVLLLLIVLGFSMTQKRGPQPLPVIDSIQVLSNDGMQLIATVFFIDGQLEYVCEQEALCVPLKEYFATTLPDIMANGAKLQIGGYDTSKCWDGVKTVSVSDKDFLKGVYTTLYDDLNHDYQVQAIERTVD